MIPLPYLLLGALLAVLASGGGGYWLGRQDGRALEAGEARKVVAAVEAARAAMTEAAAGAIAGIEITNKTIRERTETVTREVPIYRECRHDPSGLQSINAALAGPAAGAGDRELPAADAPGG